MKLLVRGRVPAETTLAAAIEDRPDTDAEECRVAPPAPVACSIGGSACGAFDGSGPDGRDIGRRVKLASRGKLLSVVTGVGCEEESWSEEVL